MGSITRNYFRRLRDAAIQQQHSAQATTESFKEYLKGISKLAGAKAPGKSATEFRKLASKKGGI